MNKGTIRPPIIIIGMHRSGTTMVSKVLDQLGLFDGAKKDANNESFFFRELNDWMIRSAGGAWDHPLPFLPMLDDQPVRAATLRYLGDSLESPRVAGFLGMRRYLEFLLGKKTSLPWGWKDPRNTFTLPLWLELFPEAKVIHVVRHGVDVANSLKVRADKSVPQIEKNYQSRKSLHRLLAKKKGFSQSVRCRSLEGGFSLWEEYMTQAVGHCESLKNDIKQVKYEDLLFEPAPVIKELLKFCDFPKAQHFGEQFEGFFAPQRAYAFRGDQTLAEFAETVEDRLSVFGY